MQRRTSLAVALAATSLSAAGVGAADAAAGDLRVGKRVSERALQRLEERMFGPAHAAEHRATRRWARRESARWSRKSPAQRRRASRVSARLSATGDPSTDGRWTASFPMPAIATHAALLPTGKVMFFSQKVNDYKGDLAAAYLWDPTKAPGAAGEFKDVSPAANIWCGAQTLMADGQLLVTGGNLDYPTSTSGWKGLKTVFTFDPWAERWTRQPDMARGRWYPTQTLLPDGRTLITSGFDEAGRYDWNTDIDVFNPPATRGGQGSITTIARYGQLSGAPSIPHWYPHWFVMPSGGVLNAGFTPNQSWLLNPTPGRVTGADRPNWSMTRKYGTAVLLPGSPAGSTRVMQLGGYDHSTQQQASVASTEVFDEATPSVAPSPGPSMRVARASHNTVLLPDRSMLNVGGGLGEQPGTASDANANEALAAAGPEHKQIEILDAGSRTWRLGPSQVYKRSYHSTALLLPDGRVLSAGDDRDPAKGTTFRSRDVGEIYEPAYLHRPGPRPTIVAGPDGVDFGERFDIDTDTAIASAVLVAPGAPTHANDMHQRLVPLDITPRADGSGAALTAPPNGNVAPRGYYMLFALTANGKPSVAKWVYVGERRGSSASPAPVVDPAPAPAPAATPTPTETPASPASPPDGQDVTAPQPASDTTAPHATVRVASRLSDVRRRGRLVLAVRLDEAGSAAVSTLLRDRRNRTVRLPRRGTRAVSFTRAESRRVVFRLTRSERRRLARGPLRLSVSLRASDAAGNRRTAAFTLRLRR